jgi:hypothetical protein
MRKFWILSSLLVIFALSASSQLKVINNFGQDLNVESGGKTAFISNKGAAVFQTRSKVVWLSCSTPDNKIKFVISKEASRSGLVFINASDGADATTQNKVVTYTNVGNVSPVSSSDNSQSLSALLNGSVVSEEKTVQSTTVRTTGTATNQTTSSQTQVFVNKEPITVEYYGSRTFKILSNDGQGLELIGKNDTANYSKSKNKYVIYIDKGSDLVLGVGEKKQAGQAIWPYGEIRKSINPSDQSYKINDSDVKMMATNENRKIKFKVDAPGYKVLIETDAGDIISLGDRGVSKSVELPIGQCYIRIAYTDTDGEFHPTAFMPIHTTAQDYQVIINTKALAKKLKIKNF